MFNLILYQPEIPPNTGNIIRLCANTGTGLHLIRPLGFNLEDKQLRRAGLDYTECVTVQVHDALSSCLELLNHPRVFACSTRGDICYAERRFYPGDTFLFGPETRGLPAEILETTLTINIPMRPDNRSLNLSNAAAIVLYEAWRQQGFA